MDKIQKVLVEAGRKDLAQKYYTKIVATESNNMKRIGDVLFENLKIHILNGDYSETLKDRIKDKKDFNSLKTISGVDDQDIGGWIVEMIKEHPEIF